MEEYNNAEGWVFKDENGLDKAPRFSFNYTRAISNTKSISSQIIIFNAIITFKKHTPIINFIPSL